MSILRVGHRVPRTLLVVISDIFNKRYACGKTIRMVSTRCIPCGEIADREIKALVRKNRIKTCPKCARKRQSRVMKKKREIKIVHKPGYVHLAQSLPWVLP